MRFFILIAIVFIQLLPVHADAQTVTDKVRDFTDAGGYDDAILREARRVDGYRETGDFIPLVGIPFIDETGVRSGGLAAYANSLYRVAITIAAVLAVIKIVIAGVQYMLTDVVTQKSQARKSIRTALLGLLLVVGAVLILNTVNPSLTNLEVLNLQQLAGEITPYRVPVFQEINLNDTINSCEAGSVYTKYFIANCPGSARIKSEDGSDCKLILCAATVEKDINKKTADEQIAKDIDDGKYSALIDKLETPEDWLSWTEEERNAYIDEFSDKCLFKEDGSDTGNDFIEGDTTTGDGKEVYLRLCVKP